MNNWKNWLSWTGFLPVLAGCASPYPIASPEARKVQVFRQSSTLTNQCKLIGPITIESRINPYAVGLMGDPHDRAVEQGTIQAREQALKMGGDAIVLTTVEAVSFTISSYEVIVQAQALLCQK